MQDEQLFTVSDTIATPAKMISLADAGLREREHLQEWIVSNPAILGDDILPVSFEFDRWSSAGPSPDPRDRLDILGIDPSGTLVVAELKRDRAASAVEMQAIKYAAMVSRFTPDTLAGAYAAHLTRRRGIAVAAEDALAELEERLDGPLDVTVLRRPRIILVASSFDRTTTASCVWLSEMSIDITLVRYQAYQTDSGVVLTTSQLWPVPEVEDFTVEPRLVEAQTAARVKQDRRRTTSAVARLITVDALEPGTALTLRPTGEVNEDVRSQVTAWVAQDPTRGQAVWTGESPHALRWAGNDHTYTPTGLVRHILSSAADIDRSIRGPAWWVTEDGDDLVALADALAPSDSSRAMFDWSWLHELLEQLPEGRWTTYGDLAEQVGTAPQPLGGHIRSCPECPSGWRVLGGGGREREGFTWDDPTRTDTQVEALSAEGVRFDDVGRADPAQRMVWPTQGPAGEGAPAAPRYEAHREEGGEPGGRVSR